MQENQPLEETGTKPTRVYLIFKSDKIFKAYLDSNQAHNMFEKYSDDDVDDNYSWYITSKELD